MSASPNATCSAFRVIDKRRNSRKRYKHNLTVDTTKRRTQLQLHHTAYTARQFPASRKSLSTYGSSDTRAMNAQVLERVCEEAKGFCIKLHPFGIGYTAELDARQKHPSYNLQPPRTGAIGFRNRKRNKRFLATRFSSQHP